MENITGHIRFNRPVNIDVQILWVPAVGTTFVSLATIRTTSSKKKKKWETETQAWLFQEKGREEKTCFGSSFTTILY